MSLRFRQLQAFHAIVETGTVTRAAEQLGISQPGISNLLAQLERETRFKLFERSKGRLIPTPEAGAAQLAEIRAARVEPEADGVFAEFVVYDDESSELIYETDEGPAGDTESGEDLAHVAVPEMGNNRH